MIVNGTNLKMTRGDSEALTVKLEGHSLSAGDKVEMTVRKTPKSPKLIHKEVTDFPNGEALISIEPGDTERMQFGEYVYDVQLTYGGAVKTIVPPSKFEIGEEVTYG